MPYVIKIVLIVVAVMVSVPIITILAAEILHNRRVKAEAAKLLRSARLDQPSTIEEADLADLPDVVQKWLRRSGVVGKEKIHMVKLLQTGQMRMTADNPWMKFKAEHYVNVDRPGFVWSSKVQYAPLAKLLGIDQYLHGHGTMKIKLLGLVTIVDAKPSMEMDQGSMLRFMAEMIWYPTAALNDYITWEAIDEHSARVTMTWGEISAQMVMHFNADGDMVGSVAPRYREENGQFVLDDWGGVARSYKEFGGFRIVNQTDVVWKYQTGDFNWMQIEAIDIKYN